MSASTQKYGVLIATLRNQLQVCFCVSFRNPQAHPPAFPLTE